MTTPRDSLAAVSDQAASPAPAGLSTLTHLECTNCGERYDADKLNTVCTACGPCILLGFGIWFYCSDQAGRAGGADEGDADPEWRRLAQLSNWGILEAGNTSGADVVDMSYTALERPKERHARRNR